MLRYTRAGQAQKSLMSRATVQNLPFDFSFSTPFIPRHRHDTIDDGCGPQAELVETGAQRDRVIGFDGRLGEAERMDPLNAPANLRTVEPEEITASDLAPYMPRGMSIYYRPAVPAFPPPAPA